MFDWFRRDNPPAVSGTDSRWVVLDLETSGLDPKQDRIVEIGGVALHDGAVDLTDYFQRINAEGSGLSHENRALHGVTAAEQRDGAPLARALDAAKARMDFEMTSAVKLEYFAADQANRIRPILDPHRGSALRPQLATHPQAESMWEWPMSRWACVSDDGERNGLFIVTEAKYGVSCRDGNLGLSLLRSPAHVGYEEHAKGYAWHLSRIKKPEVIHTDLGRHRIELALGHYQLAAPRCEQPAVLAETLFTPPIPYRGRPVTPAFGGIEGGDSLIPVWAQPLDHGRFILRLHEVCGQRGTAQVRLAEGWFARKTDLLGKPLGRVLRGGLLEFQPYEIISLECARL